MEGPWLKKAAGSRSLQIGRSPSRSRIYRGRSSSTIAPTFFLSQELTGYERVPVSVTPKVVLVGPVVAEVSRAVRGASGPTKA
jgi:hypothetical protein